jgi:hypothetical protein
MRMRLPLFAVVFLSAQGASALPVCDANATDCNIETESMSIQPVPVTFKFQARVSQARFPEGRALFRELEVYLVRGADVHCREAFSDVEVQDGVLNLEIGHAIDCELSEVLAENSGLAFKVCLGGPENCLTSVQLPTAPLAVKANYAGQAREAQTADLALFSHYAGRATADRQLFVSDTLGAGYHDFWSPTADRAEGLFSGSTTYAASEGDGYIQWSPVLQSERPAAGTQRFQLRLIAADQINLHAGTVGLLGDARIAYGPGRVVGALEVSGETSHENSALHVIGSGAVAGGLLRVEGNLRVNNHLDASEGVLFLGGVGGQVAQSEDEVALAVGEGGLRVREDEVEITAPLELTGQDLPAGVRHLTVLGGSLLKGDTQVSNSELFVVQGSADFHGSVTTSSILEATGDAFLVESTQSNIGRRQGGDTLNFAGDTTFRAPAHFLGDARGGSLTAHGYVHTARTEFNGASTLSGNVTFLDGVTFTGDASHSVKFEGAVLAPNVRVAIPPGFVTHAHFNLTEGLCPAGAYAYGIWGDGRPLCRTNISIPQRGYYEVFAGVTRSDGYRWGLRVAEDVYRDEDFHLSVDGPGSAPLPIRFYPGGDVRLEVAPGTVSIPGQNDLFVGGDLTIRGTQALLECQDAEATNKIVGEAAKQTLVATCASDYTLVGGRADWVQRNAQGDCIGEPDSANSYQKQMDCRFSDESTYACEARALDAETRCLHVVARCCRVQQTGVR